MSGAVVPLLQSGHVEALRLLAELGRRSLEMPVPGERSQGCPFLCWSPLVPFADGSVPLNYPYQSRTYTMDMVQNEPLYPILST